MPKLGTGETVDNTNTSNEIYFAGDALRLSFDVGVGGKVGSLKRDQVDLTGYTVTSKAIRTELTTAGDLATAKPVQGATLVTLTTDTSTLSDGKFYAYTGASLLEDVGFANGTLPTPGSPVYVTVVTQYTEASTITNPETRTIEAKVYAFRWNPLYTI